MAWVAHRFQPFGNIFEFGIDRKLFSSNRNNIRLCAGFLCYILTTLPRRTCMGFSSRLLQCKKILVKKNDINLRANHQPLPNYHRIPLPHHPCTIHSFRFTPPSAAGSAPLTIHSAIYTIHSADSSSTRSSPRKTLVRSCYPEMFHLMAQGYPYIPSCTTCTSFHPLDHPLTYLFLGRWNGPSARIFGGIWWVYDTGWESISGVMWRSLKMNLEDFLFMRFGACSSNTYF